MLVRVQTLEKTVYESQRVSPSNILYYDRVSIDHVFFSCSYDPPLFFFINLRCVGWLLSGKGPVSH